MQNEIRGIGLIKLKIAKYQLQMLNESKLDRNRKKKVLVKKYHYTCLL